MLPGFAGFPGLVPDRRISPTLGWVGSASSSAHASRSVLTGYRLPIDRAVQEISQRYPVPKGFGCLTIGRVFDEVIHWFCCHLPGMCPTGGRPGRQFARSFVHPTDWTGANLLGSPRGPEDCPRKRASANLLCRGTDDWIEQPITVHPH